MLAKLICILITYYIIIPRKKFSKPTSKSTMNFYDFFRLKSLIVFSFIFSLSFAASAQDEEIEITDEDLKKYAVTMDSLETMKSNVKNVMAEMVKANEDITNSRFNELRNAIDDTDKLAELEATEEEITFTQSVIDKKDELAGLIKPTLSDMVKNYIGSVKMYNAIKKGLKADEELKARYDAIMEELVASKESEEDGDMSDSEGSEDTSGKK